MVPPPFCLRGIFFVLGKTLCEVKRDPHRQKKPINLQNPLLVNAMPDMAETILSIKSGRRFSPISAGNDFISPLYLCAFGALKIFTTCQPSGRRVCVYPIKCPACEAPYGDLTG